MRRLKTSRMPILLAVLFLFTCLMGTAIATTSPYDSEKSSETEFTVSIPNALLKDLKDATIEFEIVENNNMWNLSNESPRLKKENSDNIILYAALLLMILGITALTIQFIFDKSSN